MATVSAALRNRALAFYARVSTAAQNVQMQLEPLRAYALRAEAPAVEFVDEDVSGASRSRPQLDALLAAARRGEIATVVVWKFDRMARSVAHLSSLLNEFDALGVAFVSLTESVDTSTPAGRMLFHVLAAVAEFERDLIRERVAAGMRHARGQGRAIGRPRLRLDRDELLRLRDAGLSVREIASVVSAVDANGRPRRASASFVARTLREEARKS